MIDYMAKDKLPNTEESSLLSRSECNIMRGLAIILIITNNFTHVLNVVTSIQSSATCGVRWKGS